MKKVYLHLYLYGEFGIIRRFFKCLSENGFLYTIKQIFKPVDKEKALRSIQNHVGSSLDQVVGAAPVQQEPLQAIVSHINDSEPRPSGLRKYPLGSLDDILDLRLKGQKLKGVFIQAPIIDWEVPLFQRPQHMAIAMAKLGYLVFYSTSNTYENVNGFVEIYPNLFITNDLDLCFKLKNAIVSVYSTSAYFTPEKLELVRKNNKIVYEYVDHIDPKISGDATHLLLKQFNYVNDKTIDYVACSGRKLFKDFENTISPSKIAYVPNGVEYEHFESALATAHRVPTPQALYDITKKNRPVVGYYGALAPWLWYDMLKETMELLPDYDFIFIGPDYYGGVAQLPSLPNCHYLGTVDYKVLPTYASSFHVAIIPFTPGPIAQTTSPLKLFEYFALKKPVVVTNDMVECVAFKEVFSGGNAKEFAKKIQEAYGICQDTNFKNRLKEIALENTWDKRAEALHTFMENASDNAPQRIK